MEQGRPSILQVPSFLHGPLPSVHRRTRQEGRRCGEQYLKNGTFPTPSELLPVPPGEVVVAHEVADFLRDRPAWRLYMVSSVLDSLYETLNWRDTSHVRDAYEAFCRETPWGALYIAISQPGPVSAERTALRLRAVLSFWEPLQSVRYLFKTLHAELSLEELMTAACDWAMDAWNPVGNSSVRERLKVAAERMAQATREDSIEAILRQMPRALTYARGLKHLDVLAQPVFWRQRITALDAHSFEHVSAACTADLLEQLYAWDRQLGRQ